MVMLEDKGVPKVSARLRWSQGVLNFQNSPNPRVVLLSIKIDTISLKNGFPIKGDGYPMGTHRYHTGKKNNHSAFQKTECPCMQTIRFMKCLADFYAL